MREKETVGVCLGVGVLCVCVREREREKENERKREREKRDWLVQEYVSVNLKLLSMIEVL